MPKPAPKPEPVTGPKHDATPKSKPYPKIFYTPKPTKAQTKNSPLYCVKSLSIKLQMKNKI